MELIEIRNNLIKLSFTDDEKPILGQFAALTADDRSYVAQFVNIKCDDSDNHAVARLIFTYTNDGIVDEYDGSIPSRTSGLAKLSANELLDLLPIETPIKIGKLAQQDCMLSVDISLFENNFTVFSEHDSERVTLISNFARQLFRMKEKCIIIDTASVFDNYPILKLGKDFKLPLNSDMIDFIFNYELKEVDASTKAVIQDIFYAVQQYINTLKDKYISIESFIDVVTEQYKETQMPELALLKNKLLKYRDAGIFADSPEELATLKNKLSEKNCMVINLSDISDELQKEVITFIHKILETFDKYVYFFVPLSDENSDKKLIRHLINHEHVFTTLFASHTYKYAHELKEHAQNILFFAPLSTTHDFASYNTFLSKLNPNEAVMYGKLTQGIPFITYIEDLDLDLTKDDVFGDKTTFVPAIEDDLENVLLPETPALKTDTTPDLSVDENIEKENSEAYITSDTEDDHNDIETSEEYVDFSEDENNSEGEIVFENDRTDIIQPVENIMQDEDDDFEDTSTTEIFSNVDTEPDESSVLTEDDLDFIEANQTLEDTKEDIITMEDFENFEEETPIVPVYSPEEDSDITSNDIDQIGLQQGDSVSHPRYGNGVVEKIIKYGNKTLCSITFDNVGRRLLDPTVSELQKI